MDVTPSFLQMGRPKDSSLLWATFIAILAHAIGFGLALMAPSTPVEPKKQKVVVKTVKLQPITPATPVSQPVPKIETIPQLIAEAETSKVEQVITPPPAPAEVAPAAPKPEPKVIETPKIEPEKPVEQPKKKPEVAPKKKTEVKPAEKKPAPVKKVEAPKKATPKPAKTTTPQAPVKKVTETPKPKPKAEPKKPTAEEIAAIEAEKVRQKELTAAAEAAKARQQELLSRAKENIAKIGESRHKIGTGKIGSTLDTTDIPKQLANLQIDALPTGTTVPVEFSAKEASYRDEVAGRLKLGLRLPDYGAVKIKLTLDRAGKVTDVQIVSSESSKNRQYVEKTLPTLKFPPFGSHFADASQYTFMVTLNND